MNYAALIISILALSFTIFSFWWMNWRTGRLRVGMPRSYAAFASANSLILEFPLVFFNDGPTPIVVENLRVIILDEALAKPLSFTATVGKLGTDQNRALATQFPVKGREALLLICEFQRRSGNFTFEARGYKIDLQARLGGDGQWQSICRFPLDVTSQDLPALDQQFIAHDNMPED